MSPTAPPSPQDLRNEVVDDLARRDLAEQGPRLASLPADVGAEVFRSLEAEHQAGLLDHLPTARKAALLAELRVDERARLLAAAGDDRRPAMLDLLDAGDRIATEQLLRHPKESVGRLMTPNYLAVGVDHRREEVLDQVRRCSSVVDTVYTLPVVDGSGALVGVVELRAVVAAGDGTSVAALMRPAEPVLHPDQDQELAARLMLSSELLALPVVDGDGRLVGLVTVDDAMEVLELEQAEDVSRGAGAEPLGQPYLSTSLLRLARSRATWLLVLAVAATLTVNVLELFEAELEQVVTLALFIPLLIGTGGNAGAQSTTTVVRAMAVGGVQWRDLAAVLGREARVGLLLGALLGALAFLPVWGIYEARMAAVVSLTLVSICTIATLAGALLPLVARRLGQDPAIVSAPFVTTVVDASGLVVYFLYARAFFGL